MNEQLDAQRVNEPILEGKPRFTRKRRKQLRIVETKVNGAMRFKVAGYYVAGRRVRKFFPTSKEAEEFIKGQTQREENIGALAKNLDVRDASDTAEAALMLRPFNVRLLDVVREWKIARESLSQFPDAGLTDAARHYCVVLSERAESWKVDEGVTAWLANLAQKRRSDIYIAGARWRAERFGADYGSLPMADVSPTLIEKWIEKQGDISPQTQKNFLTVLGSLFAFAVKRKKAPRNPVLEIEKPEVVREEAGILKPAELRALLRHLPDDTVPFVVLSAFAGLRPAEVQRLEWQDINFETGIVSVRASKSKTKRRRTVEMPENLKAWLRPLAKDDGKVVALAEFTIREKRMKPARTAAKLKRWPHDCLRHSAATYWLETERDAAKVALWLGHDQDVLHRHYKGLLTKPKDAAEWFAIMPTPGRAKKRKLLHFRAA